MTSRRLHLPRRRHRLPRPGPNLCLLRRGQQGREAPKKLGAFFIDAIFLFENHALGHDMPQTMGTPENSWRQRPISCCTVNSTGFPPIATADAKVLILGSLPGRVSLLQGKYYAQPRNAFWRIIGKVFDIAPDLLYVERTRRLAEERVALWDVCAAAQRPGSLDSAISYSSVIANDFAAFLAAHPKIEHICFNGGKAAELYRRIVLPGLPVEMQSIRTETLPSTSPAHASMPFEEKLSRWSLALLPALAVSER